MGAQAEQAIAISERGIQMSRHELSGSGFDQASHSGISLFRGRSGEINSRSPESVRLPESQLSPLFSPSPRFPQTPPTDRRHKRVIGQALSLAFSIAFFGCMIYWVSGKSDKGDHFQQARHAFWRGDWNETIAQGDALVRLAPENPEGYSFRAQAYWKLGQYRPAAANYRKLIELTPTDNWGYPALWQNLAYTEDYYGDHLQAIRDFTQAIALNPAIPDKPGSTADAEDDTGDSHKGRLWAYYHTKQYALAMQDCNALIAVHPYPSSIAVRGKLYAKMGDYKSALRDFQTALGENPRLQIASYLEAALLGQMHQFKAAVSVTEAEAREYPTDVVVMVNLGWWQYRAGQLSQAIVSDQKALLLNKNQPIALNNLGLTYATIDDWPNAESAYRKSLQISQEDRQAALVDVQSALLVHPHSAALRQARVLLSSAQSSAK